MIAGDDYRDYSFYSIQQGTSKPVKLVEELSFTIDEGDNSNMSNTGDTINETTLTVDEIRFLKQFVANQQQVPLIDDASEILNSIESLSAASETAKKTFVLDVDVIKQLDSYCDAMRIRKSDFLSVAIRDVLNKY